MNLIDADLSYQPTGAERRGLVRLNTKLLNAWKGVKMIGGMKADPLLRVAIAAYGVPKGGESNRKDSQQGRTEEEGGSEAE